MRYPGLLIAILPLLSPAYARAENVAAKRAIVEGDVVNPVTGAPIAGVRVKLDPRQAEPLYLKSDAAGHFVFREVPPALYLWSVDAAGFLLPQPSFLDLTVPEKGPICAAPGSAHTATGGFDTSTDRDGTIHARISVPLTAYAVVTGRVTDPDGMPLEDGSVAFLLKRPVQTAGDGAEDYPRATVQTNDKGEFRAARLEPGTYYVVANKSNLPGSAESGYRATYYPRAIDLASAKPLELPAGGRARADIRIASQAGIRIAGRLVKPAGPDGSGGPETYTNIVLVPERGFLITGDGPSAIAKDDYALDDVLPGKYSVIALTREMSIDPLGGNQKPVFGLMRTIEVGAVDMNGVDLVLQPLRDLSGAVSFPAGCTPFPVSIRAQSMHSTPADAVSDADGKFILRGLGAGKFTVSVSSPGQWMLARSMRLGNRDVEKDGFESPLAGDEPLLIEVGCGNSRRAQ